MTFKKALSLFLVFCMCLSFVPVSAFADFEDDLLIEEYDGVYSSDEEYYDEIGTYDLIDEDYSVEEYSWDEVDADEYNDVGDVEEIIDPDDYETDDVIELIDADEDTDNNIALVEEQPAADTAVADEPKDDAALALSNAATFNKTAYNDPVAQIGETEYATLQAAFDAVQDGQTITLLKDVTENVYVANSITLDLGANTLKAGEDDVYALYVDGGAVSVIADANGKIDANGQDCAIYLQDGKAILADPDLLVDGPLTLEGGKFDITAGSFSVDPSAYVAEGSKAVKRDDRWVVTTSYTITYMDGETPIEGLTPAAFTCYDETVTLPATATKEHCDFDSWHLKADLSDEAVTSFTVTAETLKNQTFYAKWTENVAYIGDVGYPTLAGAIEAVQSNETVTLLKDTSVTALANIAGKTGVVIDLGGKTVAWTAHDWHVNEGSTVTIQNGTIDITGAVSDGDCIIGIGWYNDSANTLTLDEITLTGDNYSSAYAVLYAYGNGVNTLNLNDCTVELTGEQASNGGAFKGGSVANNKITITDSELNLDNISRGFTTCDVTVTKSQVAITNSDNGFNGSAVTIDSSDVSVTNGSGRGITAGSNPVVIKGDSAVTLSGNAEGDLRIDNGASVSVEDTATLAPTEIKENGTTKIADAITVAATATAPHVLVSTTTADVYDAYTDLAAAFEAIDADGKTVKLIGNDTSTPIEVSATATLDVGEYNVAGQITVAAGKTLTIEGTGEFTAVPTLGEGSALVLKGGTYPSDVNEYCADGYYAEYDSDTKKFTVKQGNMVAKIVTDGIPAFYETVQAAVDAAQESDVIVMIADYVAPELKSLSGQTGSVTVGSGKKLTIDLNGYTISTKLSTGGSDYYYAHVLYVNGGDVTVTDSSDAGTGAIVNTAENSYSCTSVVYVTNSGSFTMNGGTVLATTGEGMRIDNAVVVLNAGAKILAPQAINGGGWDNSTSGIEVRGNGTLTVDGAEISSTMRAAIYSDAASNSITITDGVLTGNATYGVINGDNADQVTTITGGYFSTDPTAFLDVFTYRAEVASGEYEGYYHVVPVTPVTAEVHNLEELIAATEAATAESPAAITVKGDIVIDTPVVLGATSTMLVEEGYSVSIVDNGVLDAKGRLTNNGTVTTSGTGFLSNPGKVEGNGTLSGYQSGNPYTISTAMDLQWLSYLNSEWYQVTDVVMAADIRMPDGVIFEPINGFCGTFDGQGHSISNLVLESDSDAIGMFINLGSSLDHTYVQNLTLNETVTTNSGYAGGLAYITRGPVHITGVTMNGSVTATGATYGLGAFVGYAYNNGYHLYVADSVNNMNVEAQNGYNVGAIAGTMGNGQNFLLGVYNFTNNGNMLAKENSTGFVLGYGYGPTSGSTMTIDVISYDNTGKLINDYGEFGFATNRLCVNGGKFTSKVDYVSTEYTAYYHPDTDTYDVEANVAAIGDNVYRTLNEAFSHATNGETVTLLANIVDEELVIANTTKATLVCGEYAITPVSWNNAGEISVDVSELRVPYTLVSVTGETAPTMGTIKLLNNVNDYVIGVDGKDIVVSNAIVTLENNGVTYNFFYLADAIAKANELGGENVITLNGNTVLNGGFKFWETQFDIDGNEIGEDWSTYDDIGAIIGSDVSLTLNLNGHDVVGYVPGVMIYNDGTLVVNGEGHVYSVETSGSGRHAIYNSEIGDVTINSGTFGDADDDMTNDNPYQRGNALYNLGTATVNGGRFTAINFLYDNRSVWSYAISNVGGTMTINNATAYGKTNGLIYNGDADGTLTINNGSFTLSKSPTATYNYQVVGAGGTSTTYIKGGTFNHESVGGEAPYALRTLNTSKIYVSGGDFHYNNAIWGNWGYTASVFQAIGGKYDKNDVNPKIPTGLFDDPSTTENDAKFYTLKTLEGDPRRYEVVEDADVVAYLGEGADAVRYTSFADAATVAAAAQDPTAISLYAADVDASDYTMQADGVLTVNLNDSKLTKNPNASDEVHYVKAEVSQDGKTLTLSNLAAAASVVHADDKATGYGTFADAVTAMSETDKYVKLLADVADSYTLDADKTLKVYKNNFNVTVVTDEKGKVVIEETTEGVTTFWVITAPVSVTHKDAEEPYAYYATLSEAFDNVTDGDTVTVLQDVPLTTAAYIENKDLTLDLGEFTVTGAANVANMFILVAGKDAKLTLAGEEGSQILSGSKSRTARVFQVNSGATLTIDVPVVIGGAEGYTSTSVITNNVRGTLIISAEAGFGAGVNGNGDYEITAGYFQQDVSSHLGGEYCLEALAGAYKYHVVEASVKVSNASSEKGYDSFAKAYAAAAAGDTVTVLKEEAGVFADDTTLGKDLTYASELVADGAVLTVTAGKFDVYPAKKDEGKLAISGGLFKTPVKVEDCKEDYRPVESTDEQYPYTVDIGTGVAKIGDTYYTTLEAANAASKGGDTIELVADVEIQETIALKSGVTLNGGGHTISVGGEKFKPGLGDNSAIQIVQMNNTGSVLKNVTLTSYSNEWDQDVVTSHLLAVGGSGTIEDVTFRQYSTRAKGADAINTTGAATFAGTNTFYLGPNIWSAISFNNNSEENVVTFAEGSSVKIESDERTKAQAMIRTHGWTKVTLEGAEIIEYVAVHGMQPHESTSPYDNYGGFEPALDNDKIGNVTAEGTVYNFLVSNGEYYTKFADAVTVAGTDGTVEMFADSADEVTLTGDQTLKVIKNGHEPIVKTEGAFAVVQSDETIGEKVVTTYSVQAAVASVTSGEDAEAVTTYFATLTDAIAAAVAGDTVTLLTDIDADITGVETNNGVYNVDKAIIIDGDGKEITAEGTTDKNVHVFNVIAGGATIKNVKINGIQKDENNSGTKHGVHAYGFEGTLTLENVTVKRNTGYGVCANGAAVVASNLISIDNGWGGVNVDSNSSRTAATFTLNGDTSDIQSLVAENTSGVEQVSAVINAGTVGSVEVKTLDKVTVTSTVNTILLVEDAEHTYGWQEIGENLYQVVATKYRVLNLSADPTGNARVTKADKPNEQGTAYMECSSVTVAVELAGGYLFDGWYSGDVKLSEDLVYTFDMPKAEDNTPYELTAKCTVNGETFDLEVHGEYFYVTNEGDPNAFYNGVEQENTFKQTIPAGTDLTVRNDSEKIFLYWKNDSDKIVSTDPEYRFTLMSHTVLTAEYQSNRERNTVVYIVSAYEQVLNTITVNNTNTVERIAEMIQMPVEPTRPGYTFQGWTVDGIEGEPLPTAEVPEATANYVSVNKPRTVKISPVFTQNPAQSTVTYVINGVPQEPETLTTAGIKRYAAPAEVDGKTFTAWATDEEGINVVSFSKYVYFLVEDLVNKNFTFYALYDRDDLIPQEKAQFYKKFIYMLDLDGNVDQTTGKFRAEFKSVHVVPDGYTVTGFGTVYTDQESVAQAGLTTENAKKVSKAATPMQDSLYTYTITTSTQKMLYFRGYVELKENSTGLAMTLYTDLGEIQATPNVV